MNYKDVLIRLASMTVPYVYDDTISFLELDRKLYKIVHELILAMQGLNTDYEQFKTDMTSSFNEFTGLINDNFNEFKSDVNNQINTFKENITSEFNTFKEEIEGNFNTLEGEFNTLKTYVDNYFENLNLDEEVQAVIQKMYDDGTLANIINEAIFTELNTKIDNLQEQVEKIITDCGTGNLQGASKRYYVYSSAFGTPVDKQLFTIQMPNLPAGNNDVSFYNREQSGLYSGWQLNNVKALDVSNQLLLVQASVIEDVTAFNIVGILPSKEIIADKISDLLVTNCGTGSMQGAAKRYYVYSSAFGTPVDKQLFTIQMPNLPAGNNDVSFYNREQSGLYSGWQLNNVKALDVSNQLLLVQASVIEDVTAFNIVGILPNNEIIKALDIMNTQTSITDTGNIDTSELKPDGGTSYTVNNRACNIQISTNEDKTRYLITGMLGISGNPGNYVGNIKIPLNSDGAKTGKCLGSAIVLNPIEGGFQGVLNQSYFTTSVTETHLLINIQSIKLETSTTSWIYLPMIEVVYE